MATNSITRLVSWFSFLIVFWLKLVKALLEYIIIQSEPEKQNENQISLKKFRNLSGFDLKISNASDFEKKFSQRVRFWLEKFTKRQFLDWKKIQRVKFWINNFSKFQILKNNLHLKNQVLVLSTPWKPHILHFSWFLKKLDFDMKSSLRVRFWVKKLQRVRFWI